MDSFSASNPNNDDLRGTPFSDRVPRTTADITLPKSTTSSTSTTASIVPKPTQTATSAPAEPNLQTLNEDILSRIASHVLADSRRGTPHYPSKECMDALKFAKASAALSQAVARHLKSDHPWLDVSDADTTMNGLEPAFQQKVLSWYTIAAPYLTALHLHSKLTYFPELRARVMDKLLDARPRLKFINLSSFDKMAEPPMHDDLAELLAYSRESISSITLDLTTKLLDVVCKASLTCVTTLDVKVGPYTTAENLVSLLKSVASEEFPLTTLKIRTMGVLPGGLTPQTVFAAAPRIQNLHYHDGGMNSSAHSLEEGFLRLARSFNDIQSISFHRCVLDLSSLHNLLDWEKYPLLHSLELVECIVEDLSAVLAAASNRIQRLELAQHVDRTALQAIGRCKNVKELGITMKRSAVQGLSDCLANLDELTGLTLSFHGSGPRVERQVIEALERTGKKFEKFVLHGETLQYEGIRHVMRLLGRQLQYWVTGIYTPTKSRTKIIMRLLRDTARYNPNMKVLCFGLGLTYDKWAAELHEDFLQSIDVVGKQLEGLDTYWLKNNAKSILEKERPADYADYESDESDLDTF